MIDQEEIYSQLLSNDPKERIGGLKQLKDCFSQMPDKQQVWKDLIKLTNDKNNVVRYVAAYSLGSPFSQVPDRQQAWNDLHQLTNDKISVVRYGATYSLVSSFSQVPDKQQAWNDLIKLTSDKDNDLKFYAARSLGTSFPYVPDKQQAWNDLIKLISDGDIQGYSFIVSSLVPASFHFPDKQQAWNDLIKLTNEKIGVRYCAFHVLFSIVLQVPDKQQAWNDLIKLTHDDECTRAYANHCLGKISIFRASKAKNEEDYKKELENAISYFEKATQGSYFWPNPSKFCFPFYRSFYTIIFKKQDAKEEVEKYLAKMKNYIMASKNKELLFEAVNNLANALSEVQNLRNHDLELMKGELDSYRKYCDRALELVSDTEESAPFATATLKKGLPILERNIKAIIKEIQEKAKTACKEAKGTHAEYATYAVNDFAKKLRIGSPEYLVVQIENLVFLLKSYIPKIEENNLILDRIDKILREEDVVIQYTLLNNLIPQIIDIQMSEKTASILSEIKCLRASVDKLVDSIDELQSPQEYLSIIQQNLEEIKNNVPEMKEKIDKVLYDLYTPLSTTQKLKIAIPIIPLLVSYEQETDVPSFVADRICELKNLVLRKKGK